MLRSPLVIGALVVLGIIGVVVFSATLRDLAADRARLTREQREREDEALRWKRSQWETERDLDVVASVFDPLGLFH